MSSVAVGVAVVGGAGLVGAALTDVLVNAGHRVVVVDRARPCRATAFVHVDLLRTTGDDLDRAFAGVDVVVHLVARVDPPRDDADRALMRRLHDEGSRVVVDAARRAGVSRFVLVSSAVVYGARATNPVPLFEDAPVAPCPFPYAEDKALQEAVVRAAWNDDDSLAVVRPAIVYGREAKNYLTEIVRRARLPWPLSLLHGGILPALDGHRPPLQFVHVDDVARVVAAAATRDVHGVFHACACDWLSYEDVAAACGLVVKDVDARVVGAVLDALVPVLPPWLRAPSTLFPYLMHPFVLSAEKTRRELGVTTSSSLHALRSIL